MKSPLCFLILKHIEESMPPGNRYRITCRDFHITPTEDKLMEGETLPGA